MRIETVLNCILSFVALTSFGAMVSAADPTQEKKDPQSSFEPRSQPGAGQRFLERFVGEWQIVKKFYPRTGDPAIATGICRQTMIHDGRFLKPEFVFEQDGKKTTGLGIIGFDPDSGKFTSFWTDSRSTRMSIRASDDKFNGAEIVMFSRSLDPSEKQPRRSRTVTRLEDGGRKIVHRQYAIAPTGDERLMMELLMTRSAQ
jgi:Protein of unknown function (DUF1579)